ncbi:thiol-disulfide isomerase/thioredoxin [Parabacteroides sp. PFB2-10]|uniref:TlpA family protein disulfide reductase n=1 Tax=Parabacteroides sp. PFB2-10 TaxID=1742405 RepID=UPI002475F8C1|nr:TlpA disulfide reductase family protein [Parabacteroides sp. PFB2-10]MDH6313563.1 thiol-disulfide isomerase/thioredoxin [Parabacteroides sp. PFB2-10]
MKKSILLFFVLFLTGMIGLSAKNVIITNPVYEFNASGITNIAKIEITPNETRLHIHSTFIPHWWVSFPSATFIEDADTGERYTVTGMEKGELDKEIYMSASGDSTMILIFPPIDSKKVKTINYGEGDRTIVYGVSLNPKAKAAPKGEMPEEVRQWIEQELKKAPQQTLIDLDSEDFFSRQPARLIGYIKGYHPQAGFASGIVYAENELTRESSPVVIQIHEDGRFEGEIPLIHPIYKYVVFQNQIVNFYIEPGQTLSMVIDWEEFRKADRYRNRRYSFENIQYAGAAAEVNKELAGIQSRLPEVDYMKLYDNISLEPGNYVLLLDSIMRNKQETLKKILDTEALLPHTRDIIQVENMVQYYVYLLEYEMRYKMDRMQKGETDVKSLPLSFYDFLHKIPLNDQKLLMTSSFSTLINRFEYMDILRGGRSFVVMSQPKISLFDYLFNELGLPKEASDEEYIAYSNKMAEKKEDPSQEEQKEIMSLANAFNAKYKEQVEAYMAKYVKQEFGAMYLSLWQQKDSVYTHVLGLPPSLMYDIAKVREMKFDFEQLGKEEALDFLAKLILPLPHSFLKAEAVRLYNDTYAAQSKGAYKLPPGKGTDIFRSMADQFKGKYIFVDFWATTCGPCISGIKSQKEARAKYKDSPDVTFLFITNDRESPLKDYEKFVEEQELTNVYRIKQDDYVYLRELFKFNGIPRYVMVDREGRIMDDNFQMYNFEQTLEKVLKEEND